MFIGLDEVIGQNGQMSIFLKTKSAERATERSEVESPLFDIEAHQKKSKTALPTPLRGLPYSRLSLGPYVRGRERQQVSDTFLAPLKSISLKSHDDSLKKNPRLVREQLQLGDPVSLDVELNSDFSSCLALELQKSNAPTEIANSVPLQTKKSKILSRFNDYLESYPTLPITPALKPSRKRKKKTPLRNPRIFGKRIAIDLSSLKANLVPTLRERTPRLSRMNRKIIEDLDCTVIQKSLL